MSFADALPMTEDVGKMQVRKRIQEVLVRALPEFISINKIMPRLCVPPPYAAALWLLAIPHAFTPTLESICASPTLLVRFNGVYRRSLAHAIAACSTTLCAYTGCIRLHYTGDVHQYIKPCGYQPAAARPCILQRLMPGMGRWPCFCGDLELAVGASSRAPHSPCSAPAPTGVV